MTLQTEVKAAAHTTKWIAIKYHGDDHGVNTWAKWKSSESIRQFSFHIHLQPNWSWIQTRPLPLPSIGKGNFMLIFLGQADRYQRAAGRTKRAFHFSILSLLNSSALQKICYRHLPEKWNAPGLRRRIQPLLLHPPSMLPRPWLQNPPGLSLSTSTDHFDIWGAWS